MIKKFLLATSVLTLVSGCMGGSSSGESDNVEPEPDPNFFGAEVGATSGSNGLAFAEAGDLYTDTEGQEMTARLIRFETDYATGETSIVSSDETITIDIGGTDTGNLTVTYRGETVAFVDGDGLLSNGQDVYQYLATNGDVSGTLAIYSYTYGADAPDMTPGFDSEGFFAFGFQTDPATIAAAMGSATFSGDFVGYGQELDTDGSVIEEEIGNEGTISLMADFSTNNIGGSLTGTVFGSDGDVAFTGDIADASINGNGFSSNIEISCDGCVTGSDSVIGGVFYGDDAQEISGVMGLDVTGVGGSYVGSAGFTAIEE